jgi:hypothetical protein
LRRGGEPEAARECAGEGERMEVQKVKDEMCEICFLLPLFTFFLLYQVPALEFRD